MTDERENDKEQELAHNDEEEHKETEVREEEDVDEEQLEAEEPSFPSDADPFLLHMLRCENFLERLGPSLESQAGANQCVQDAFIAINEGEYGTALKALDEARNEDEHTLLIPLLSAIALLKQGEVPQAASQCDAALALDTLNPDAWLCKATIEIAEHRFVDACESLSKAIELAPNDVEVLVSQGACFIRLGRFDEAIRVLYRAQKIDHSSIRAWVNKGVAYAYANRLKDALNCFNEALLLDPDNADARAAKEEMLRRLTH